MTVDPCTHAILSSSRFSSPSLLTGPWPRTSTSKTTRNPRRTERKSKEGGKWQSLLYLSLLLCIYPAENIQTSAGDHSSNTRKCRTPHHRLAKTYFQLFLAIPTDCGQCSEAPQHPARSSTVSRSCSEQYKTPSQPSFLFIKLENQFKN